MKNEHIINILNEHALDKLDQVDLATIKMHVAHCKNCRDSFKAAQISSMLLKTVANETFEPSPFFETKLMAVWREKQAKSVAAFWRWWQASNAVVGAMIFAVAALLFVSLLAPNVPSNQPEQASVLDNYSIEEIIFNQNYSTADLTNGQTLQIIYEQQNSK
jgi:predicted anti-sigma-YlaC factor YlaD